MKTTSQDRNANRNLKSTLFHKLFGENKSHALSLYNAMNGSSYTNEDDLEFTTLEDVVYMKMKDDVSFLLGTSLSLYEHQSTFNPNMPLRGFLYFANLYRKLIKGNERIYSKQRVIIPNPKYIVFYNGKEKMLDGNTRKHLKQIHAAHLLSKNTLRFHFPEHSNLLGVARQFIGCFQDHRQMGKLGMTYDIAEGIQAQIAVTDTFMAVFVT